MVVGCSAAEHWGPWEPYTQEVTTGLSDVFTGNTIGSSGYRSALTSFSPFDTGIFADPSARICCMNHIQAGSPMNTTWTTGFGVCPTTAPGARNVGSGGLDRSGLIVAYDGGGGTYSGIDMLSFIYEWSGIANTTLSHGVPSWQDPANAAAPPASDFNGTEFVDYQYDIFTSLDALLTPIGVGLKNVNAPFEISAMRVDYGTADWNPGGDGDPLYSLAISAGGSGTVLGGPVVLENLDAGVYIQWVPTCLHPGFFFENDPFNAFGDYTQLNMWAEPIYFITYRRYGRRRPRLSSATRRTAIGRGDPPALTVTRDPSSIVGDPATATGGPFLNVDPNGGSLMKTRSFFDGGRRRDV